MNYIIETIEDFIEYWNYDATDEDMAAYLSGENVVDSGDDDLDKDVEYFLECLRTQK